jgi:hypothetical protein
MPYEGVFRKNTKYEEGSLIPPTIDSFFFRISDKNIFYTEIETDLYVFQILINILIYKGIRGILN